MRYPGSEKLEIYSLAGRAIPPAGPAYLGHARILPMTFYRWYARLQAGGPEALEARPSRPRRVWNGIPEEVRVQSSNWRWTNRNSRRGRWQRASPM